MKRIPELDALRGIALFGILLVNLFVFHAPYSYYGDFYGAFEGLQGATVEAVVNYAGGKFLFIFAFLFGFGIVWQQRSRQASFPRYFIQRMGVLFLFGTAHIVFFWFGDILAAYALLGLLALPLVRLPDRLLLLVSLFFLLFRPLYYVGAVWWGWPLVPPGQPAPFSEFVTVFQTGSYGEILSLRMKEFMAFMPENLVWYLPKTLGLFLAGMYAARREFFRHLRTHGKNYLVLAVALLVMSGAWNTVKLDFFRTFDLAAEPFWRPILIAINVTFETTLGAAYIIGFSLLFQASRPLCQLFAKPGRLALTNYIGQSLVCVLIFYGYGLGYYGKLQPTDLVGLAVAIFGSNVLFSHLYLRYRRTGPLEYVWRKLISAK